MMETPPWTEETEKRDGPIRVKRPIGRWEIDSRRTSPAVHMELRRGRIRNPAERGCGSEDTDYSCGLLVHAPPCWILLRPRVGPVSGNREGREEARREHGTRETETLSQNVIPQSRQ